MHVEIHLCDRVACVAKCALCCILLSQNLALAQELHLPNASWYDADTSTDRAFYSDALAAGRRVRKSVAGVSMGSATVDPLMNESQEHALLRFLASYSAESWRGWSLEQLCAGLQRKAPVILNLEELEALNIDGGLQIEVSPPAGSLVARLFAVLTPHELSLTVRHGYVIVTSADAVSVDAMLRLYDVSPILHSTQTHNAGFTEYDFSSLTHNIRQHIAPDDWLAAGGANTITPVITNTRQLLAVTAPFETQLEIATALEILIRSEPRDSVMRSPLLSDPLSLPSARSLPSPFRCLEWR